MYSEHICNIKIMYVCIKWIIPKPQNPNPKPSHTRTPGRAVHRDRDVLILSCTVLLERNVDARLPEKGR